MPIIAGRSPTRRDFLKTLGASAGAALAAGCARVPFLRLRAPKLARWALLADTHVSLDPKETYRDFVIDDNMITTVRQIVGADPDGVVIAGDLARLTGRLDDYVMLWRLLKPLRERMPVAMALGNHDDRKNFRKMFRLHPGKRAPVSDKHVLIIDIEPARLRFLILDSLRQVNETAGTLGEAQRRWLKRFLDRADRRPTFLFFHHPPSSGKGDLLDYEQLFEIILPRKQVKAVFYGHTHVYRFSKVEDLDLINIPAIGYNFSDRVPVGWIEAYMTSEGGDFILRAIGGNMADNGKTTSLAWRS